MLTLKSNFWLFPSILATAFVALNGCTAEKTTSQPTSSASPAPITTSPAPQTTPAQPNQSSPAADQNGANQIALADGKVSFTLPPGFTEMTREEISFKFPNRGNPPTHAYGNEKRTVAIAVSLSNANVRPEQLPELKTVMREQLGKVMPDAEWLKEELTTINGKQWVRFSVVTQAIDTKIHNDMYLTSFEGKMLGFNFNSTVQEYNKTKSELEKTVNSIAVR